VGDGGVNANSDENVLAWVIIYLGSLIGSTLASWHTINAGYGDVAQIVFLWLPLALAVIAKIADSTNMMKKFTFIDKSGREMIRDDSPRFIRWYFGLIPAMAMMMLGYGFAHLAIFGSI
jgi:hypothetical protein